MGWIKCAACMLLIGVLVGPVGATTTEIEDVECPVCANKFRALGWASTNSVGGQGRDFLRHAAGGQVFLITCWTCPKCRYTGYSGDFSGEEMPQALIQRLKKGNPLKATEPIDPKLQDSWEIPAWVRFDLLVQTRKLVEGTKPGAFSIAWLRAAWSQRFGIWGLTALKTREKALHERVKSNERDGYERAMNCARALEKLASDADSGLAANDRSLALVLAATYYKSRGEDPDATRVLDGLGDKKLEDGVSAAVRELRKRIERERTFLRRALPYLRAEAEQEGVSEAAVANIQYLRGVIHRKLGDNERALKLLEPLQEDKRMGEAMREWVKDEIKKAKAG